MFDLLDMLDAAFQGVVILLGLVLVAALGSAFLCGVTGE